MRIVGITIPDKKHAVIALTSVHGIGRPRAKALLSELSIPHETKINSLSPEQEQSIREKVEAFMIEGDLRRSVARSIKRLKDLSTVRGYRHSVGLPTRGQKTRTNARTRKGPRRTMGSGRVKLQKK